MPRRILFGAFERVKKVFLPRSQTRPTALGSRLKRLRLAAAHSLTLARLRAEKYFLRRTCRRRKWLKLYLRLRAQTLRGFLHIPINRFGGKSCFMNRTRYSQFVFRNNTVCSGKQRGIPVIYRQSDEARQMNPSNYFFPSHFSPFLGDRPARSRSSLPAANRMAKAERRYVVPLFADSNKPHSVEGFV